MEKDWTGNKRTTWAQLGASNHTESDREVNDYYATDPHSLELLLNSLKEDKIILHNNIWECACGQGHLSKVLLAHGYDVISTDLIDRGFGTGGVDFLAQSHMTFEGDILTNPPYKTAEGFVEKALEIITSGNYVIMFLKIQFLEGKGRYKLFQHYPPKYVYVNSSRQTCYINGDMSKKMSSASCYCWYIWEKGFTGEPIIRWIKGD